MLYLLLETPALSHSDNCGKERSGSQGQNHAGYRESPHPCGVLWSLRVWP
ncbi:unnamed protein product [Staurois parvus]|uniref:Uncharacterized protein n=1 Tax=Staurois parvus TaxID=386267 RepID=A0ABN9B4U5_9NEOB|nr:unnamed protein product [Staurois parvus]